MSKILVLNGMSYGKALSGLGELHSNTEEFIKNPDEYKLVLFTGGADVTPSYYGHSSPNNLCCCNETRDKEEQIVFEIALEHKIKMVGICRGVQFLNVMAGGTMLHDVDNHSGSMHEMETSKGETIRINSLHHQMVLPPKNSYIIGWSKKKESTRYFGNNDILVDSPKKEVEAVLFPHIGAAGVQYHPEIMSTNSEGREWFFNLTKRLIEENSQTIVNKYLEK